MGNVSNLAYPELAGLFDNRVELREGCCQLSASGARACDDNDRFLRLYVIGRTVAFVAHDHLHIRGIPFGEAVGVNRDVSSFSCA